MLKRVSLYLLLGIVAVLVFTFTAWNSGDIELNLLFVEGTYPKSITLMVTFVCGMIFGMLSMTAFVFRLISERRTLRRSLQVSESEVSSLRNLPLSDAD